jgi:DNA transformation protein
MLLAAQKAISSGDFGMSDELAQLRNIGPTVRTRLNEIGVFTRTDLHRIGAVKAYKRICENYPNQTIPVCYYLYSLHGALIDVHWDELPETLKDELYAKAKGQKRGGARGRR